MKSLFTALFAFIAVVVSAQSVGTTVKFNKANQPALMLYLPYNQEVAEGTIISKLKENGFEPETKGSLFWKQNKVDGYYVFKGVTLKGEQPEIVDLYFKVDQRGRKKDNQSVMYMLTSKGAVPNFVSSMSEPTTYASSQTFLNSFVGETATYKHGLDVKAQEETVRKAEKKLADLVGNEKDMADKIARLQADMEKNRQEQTNQQATIEAEKKKLEELKAKQ